MDISNELKKVFLASAGAIAVSAKTAKDIADKLIETGEETIEKGKIQNEELKYNIKEKMKNHVNIQITKNYPDVFSAVEHMSKEEREKLKKQLEEMDTTSPQQSDEDKKMNEDIIQETTENDS